MNYTLYRRTVPLGTSGFARLVLTYSFAFINEGRPANKTSENKKARVSLFLRLFSAVLFLRRRLIKCYFKLFLLFPPPAPLIVYR